MSLYEQFHSDINKKFMYDMLKNLVLKEKGFDISLEAENYNAFLQTFTNIFNENNVDTIEEINQILLDHNYTLFLKNKETSAPQFDENYEKLLKEREQQTNFETPQPSSSSSSIVSQETKIEFPTQPFIEQQEEKITVNINSSKRTNINSSRYNYKIDLEKNSIQVNRLNKVSRMIIPIEDNYLFTIPVINLTIPELNCDIHLQQEEVISGNHRDYGVYKSIEYHTFQHNPTSRITIDIRDVSGKRYNHSDILKINIMEVKRNKIYFTCSLIYPHDYKVDDFIKIINNNSQHLYHILQEPLKIKKIQDNIIICGYNEIEDLENETYTNIDMKIMNMSNQNIIYFN